MLRKLCDAHSDERSQTQRATCYVKTIQKDDTMRRAGVHWLMSGSMNNWISTVLYNIITINQESYSLGLWSTSYIKKTKTIHNAGLSRKQYENKK